MIIDWESFEGKENKREKDILNTPTVYPSGSLPVSFTDDGTGISSRSPSVPSSLAVITNIVGKLMAILSACSSQMKVCRVIGWGWDMVEVKSQSAPTTTGIFYGSRVPVVHKMLMSSWILSFVGLESDHFSRL